MNFFKRISFLERQVNINKSDIQSLSNNFSVLRHTTKEENYNGFTVFNTFALIFGFFGAWTIKDNINWRINALENDIKR